MQRTISRLDSAHRKLYKTVSAIDPDLMIRRPGNNQWSVAEVMHHLCLVEERVLAELHRGVALPPHKTGILKKLIPMRIVSWRFVRVKAPKAVSPEKHLPREQLFETYNGVRNRLKNFCLQYSSERLRLISFRHPLLGKIDGVAAVSFVAFHEERHHKQIREIVKKLSQSKR